MTPFRETTWAEDGTEPVAIVDIIVIDIGTGVIAGYARIVLIVLLGKPLRIYYFHSYQNPKAGPPESGDASFSDIPKFLIL